MPKYVFEQAQLTCDTLEDELGVARGSVAGIITYPSGAVEVETKEVWTPNGQNLIKDALVRRGLPRGKKTV